MKNILVTLNTIEDTQDILIEMLERLDSEFNSSSQDF
jgi:hypothetical protein